MRLGTPLKAPPPGTALPVSHLGLGFSNFVTETTGANFSGQTDIYSQFTLDITNSTHWSAMTNAQRAASAFRFGRVVWDGPAVTGVLGLGSTEVRVTNPPAIAGTYQFGTAAFGPLVSSVSVSGNVVAAVDPADGAGPTTTDGCSPFSNAGAVNGNIALIERGTCGFALKARNATDAGAIGVIIYNNAANANAVPPGMATDPVNGPLVTIPTVSLMRADGLAILGASGSAAFIGLDPSTRTGADPVGRARLYSPFPVALGSSISHFDTVASPNQLMEPFISGDLTHSVTTPQDMTLPLLRDVGWFPDADLDGLATDADCDDTSDTSATVVIGGCDTGAPNPMFTDGCTLSDKIQAIGASASNHGQFVSGVAHFTNALRKAGLITEAQKTAIRNCAAQANIP